jgi:hypothetical protein
VARLACDLPVRFGPRRPPGGPGQQQREALMRKPKFASSNQADGAPGSYVKSTFSLSLRSRDPYRKRIRLDGYTPSCLVRGLLASDSSSLQIEFQH